MRTIVAILMEYCLFKDKKQVVIQDSTNSIHQK